jgi:hypothetical protein
VGTPLGVVLAGALILGTGRDTNWVNGVIRFNKHHQISGSYATWLMQFFGPCRRGDSMVDMCFFTPTIKPWKDLTSGGRLNAELCLN